MLKNLDFEKKQKLKEKLLLELENCNNIFRYKGELFIQRVYSNFKRKDNLLKTSHQLSIEIIKNQSEKKIRINKNLKENINCKN